MRVSFSFFKVTFYHYNVTMSTMVGVPSIPQAFGQGAYGTDAKSPAMAEMRGFWGNGSQFLCFPTCNEAAA
jgi:hypothetical protein